MFSVVVSSVAGVGSVSVVSGSVGAVAEGSGVVVSLSAGVLLGVVGAVGVVGAAGSVVTALSGVWVLFCCEPVAVISPPLESVSLLEYVPHFGVKAMVVPAAAFTVKVNVPSAKSCSV